MTHDEQIMAIGSIVNELAEKKRLLVCLEARASVFADALSLVASALRGDDYGEFEDNKFYQKPGPGRSPTNEVAWPSPSGINAVMGEIATVKRRISELEDTRAKLGV